MKKLITFLLVIFIVTNLCAQDRVTDSLKLLLSKEKTDTGRVRLFVDIGRRFGYGFATGNDSSFWYLQQALYLSKKINYTKGELMAKYRISEHFFFSSDYPQALKMSLQNLKQMEQLKDTVQQFWQTRLISWIYRSLGDYKAAFRYAKKLKTLIPAGSSGDPLWVKNYQHYDDMINANLGVAYSNIGMLDSALYYQVLDYQAAVKEGDAEGLALTPKWIGDTYYKMGNGDSAFYFYKMSIPYAVKSGRKDFEAEAKLGIAAVFYKKRELDSAFFYARQSLEEIQNIAIPGATMNADSLLSQLFRENHQYDSAYKYLQNYIVLKDSIYNQTKIAQAQNFVFNEAMQQQQLEQAKKDAQQQYAAKIKLYILVAIILIFLIIAFLLLRNLRNKRKANLLLSKQKEEIQNTLSELKSTQKQLIQSEKMASLGELTAGIAHEIQNPLNFVNNFSDVNQELIDEMKSELSKGNGQEAMLIADDIKENEQKINHHGKRADAIVKGMLQHSKKSTGQKELTDINALADEYLRLSYHGMRAKDKTFNAEMKTDFDETIGKINIIPQDIGRVLLNLFNNAFYAVNDRLRQAQPDIHYEPTVSVTTKKLGNSVLITVSDNGNGIPQNIVDKIFQPFFTTKPTGEGTGLGLSLSYDIVKAHGGELKVNIAEGEFTEFVVLLPL